MFLKSLIIFYRTCFIMLFYLSFSHVPLTHPRSSDLPSLHCSITHAMQFSKLILCQSHAFAKLSYLPALPVIKKLVVLVQQVGDIDFKQFRNPAEIVYGVVVVLWILIMDISALVNLCIFSDFPFKAGIFYIGNTTACPLSFEALPDWKTGY